jgi:putative PIN family toxin of toxin-antitoxin system
VIPRVLGDTNVLVSASIAGGPPSRVLEAAIDDRIELVLADPVLGELERVLKMKLGFEAERVRELRTLLISLASERVEAPDGEPEAITGDLDDDLILACAVDAKVQIVVSGDRRHLLSVGEHRGVRILSPQALLAELAGEGSQRDDPALSKEAEKLLRRAYEAFNARDIESAIATMHPEVDWPNGMEGGCVHGHQEVRDYWQRQFTSIDSHVDPERIEPGPDGRIAVTVRQVVRDHAGKLLSDKQVEHHYLIADGLIRRMDIYKALG